MNESRHPLLSVLRNGKLWHCTGVEDFAAIRADGYVKPFDGESRWGGGKYACQTFGAVCLFDFTTPSESEVLSTQDKWQHFVNGGKPITVILGMDSKGLPGKIIRYPETRDDSQKGSHGPIPYVEVCHVGAIPMSAVKTYLYVYKYDSSQYRRSDGFDESAYRDAQTVFTELCGIVEAVSGVKMKKLKDSMAHLEEKAKAMKRNSP